MSRKFNSPYHFVPQHNFAMNHEGKMWKVGKEFAITCFCLRNQTSCSTRNLTCEKSFSISAAWKKVKKDWQFSKKYLLKTKLIFHVMKSSVIHCLLFYSISISFSTVHVLLRITFCYLWWKLVMTMWQLISIQNCKS